MQKDETNQIIQENDLASKNMDEIGELNQHDHNMLTEETFFYYLLYLFKGNQWCTYIHAQSVIQKFVCSAAILVKIMNLIFRVLFLSRLKMLSKVKLILNPIWK